MVEQQRTIVDENALPTPVVVLNAIVLRRTVVAVVNSPPPVAAELPLIVLSATVSRITKDGAAAVDGQIPLIVLVVTVTVPPKMPPPFPLG